LSEKQETLQADVNQIKDQMSQILEALAALQSARETPVIRNEEITSSYPPISHSVQNNVVQGGKVAHAEFPPYGLPPGYTPPMAEYPRQEHMTITVPVNSSDPYATSVNTAKMAAGPEMIAQPRFQQVLMGETTQTKAAT